MTTVEDYVKGEPTTIRRTARQIDDLHEDFRAASNELNSVGTNRQSSDWFGAAAKQFDLAIEDLPADLGVMATAHERVARALINYANEVAELRREARTAVERLKIARAEQEASGGQARTARARVISLTTQLGAAKVVETQARAAHITASVAPTGIGDAAARTVYENARSTVHTLSCELSDSRSDERRHREAHDRAQAEGDRQQARLDGYKSAWERAETQCAQAIDDALPDGLKNPAWYEKAADWLVDQFENFVELAVNRVRLGVSLFDFVTGQGTWDEVVYRFRQVLDSLIECLDFAMIVVAVAGVIAAPFTGGATLALTGMILAATKLSATALKALTGIYLASNRTVIDGRQVVTWGDVAADINDVKSSTVEFAASVVTAGAARGLVNLGPLSRGPRFAKALPAYRNLTGWSKISGTWGLTKKYVIDMSMAGATEGAMAGYGWIEDQRSDRYRDVVDGALGARRD